MSWNTAVWGVVIVGTTILIAMSGSLTYGAATGVCGLATLGLLIATARIPNVAAVPFICLIGLSASFAELPALTAGSLFFVWISIQIADLPSRHWVASLIRIGSVFVLLLAGSLTFAPFAADATSANASDSGYELYGSKFGRSSEEIQMAIEPTVNELAQKSSAMNSVERSDQSEGVVDPFEGLAGEQQ